MLTAASTTAGVGACVAARSPARDDAARNAAAPGPNAPARASATACAVRHEERLIVGTEDGSPAYLHVEVNHRGRRGAFLVDTGTPQTCLVLPPDDGNRMAHDAGTAYVLGVSRALPGQRYDNAQPAADALPNLGFLGTDAFRDKVIELDLERGRLVEYAGCLPPRAYEWPSVPYEIRKGAFMAEVSVDGVRRRLQIDTGAPDTTIIGAVLPPCQPSTFVDQDGEVITACHGRGLVEIVPGSPENVPVDWIARWPHHERSGAVDERRSSGLLGLTSLGKRRIIFDGRALRLRLERLP